MIVRFNQAPALYRVCLACMVVYAATSCCLGTEPQQDLKKHLIQEIEDSSEWPTSGKLEGKLTLERIEKRGKTKIVRCDFRVWFAGDKVRVERDYQMDKLKEEDLREYWCPLSAKCDRQIYLSNEHGDCLVGFAGDRKECFVFSEPSRKKFTKNADFPCYQTEQILNAAHYSLDELTAITAAQMDQSGTFIRGKHSAFNYSFSFLPGVPKRLAEMVVFRDPKTVPYKLKLNWSTAGKYAYVDKYSQSLRMTNPQNRPEYNLEIEYTAFHPDSKIAPELFTISSMGVSAGTVFTDPAPYPPAERDFSYLFDGEKFVNTKTATQEGDTGSSASSDR